ncbi:MAG: hypothetical protein KME11_05025 [Timaviella obliquedivisa GSE-PSE-MK23-08B]|jgi:hypothetical protein|nr:hypothetical protein [Timaviella obliquedivisa GSE-PSE-MK23-08B]
MSIDRLLRPNLIESHTQEWKDGTVPGWIPGILTGIENDDIDPEGLGRIKVKCDLISATDNLPNGWDGWVWVLEDFVNNSGVGGSHRLLQAGTQIALLPMLGNPQQLLMLGCLHSRIDRPNPMFNRAKGVHGTHTPGEVMSIKDDVNAERTDGYPNGVIQQVSRAGDVINQTQGGARSHLQADGTVNIENPLASTVLSAEGDITQRSAGDAVSILGSDGAAVIRSEAFGSELNLAAIESVLSAPMPAIGTLINQAKQITGKLGEGMNLISELNQRFELGLDNQLSQVSNTLQRLEKGVGTAAAQGADVLDKLQEFSVDDFGKLLSSQVEQALDPAIASLARDLPSLLENFDFPRINEFLKTEGLNILPDELEATLRGLSHQPTLQAEMILSEVLPNGYESFANLSALELHGTISQVQELIDSLVLSQAVVERDATLAVSPKERAITPDLDLQAGIEKVWKLLPEGIQAHLEKPKFTELVRGVVTGESEIGDLFTNVLGQRAKGAIANASQALGRALPTLREIPQLRASLAENPPSLPALEQVMSQFSEQLTPALDEALGALNQSFHSIPSTLPTPRVVANAVMSELRSASGVSQVFASDAGAGLSTPWGSFGIGSGGFSFKGKKGKNGKQDPLIFPVTGAHNARLKIDENQGILIEGTTPEGQVLSKILVDGANITITAGEQATIEINPTGVFINGALWTGAIAFQPLND